MEIVTTPSIAWLDQAMSGCRSTIDVASPFVGRELRDFFNKAPSSIRITLLTRTRLVDFAAGASNLEAVAGLAGSNVRVLSLDRLHAKTYVFDNKHALVTSANATFSGLRRNIECGIAVTDAFVANSLGAQVRSGFGAMPAPTVWSESQLRALIPSVDFLKSRLPTRAQIRAHEGEAAQILELPKADAEELLSSRAGWTRLVFQQLLRTGSHTFTTEKALQACAPEISRRYPANRHPREKVRQQLQVLRDLGLIEFLTPGHYRLAVITTA